jgi:hypothetical protein
MSKSLLEEVKKSILLALLSLLAIPAAFFLVYLASQIPESLRKLASAKPAAEARPGDFAYATGKIKASLLADSPFLRAGPYLRLERQAQIYAWTQVKENSAPDGQEPSYKYSCREEWTSQPDEDIEKRRGCQERRNYGRKFFLDQNRSIEELQLQVNGSSYSIDPDFSAAGFAAPVITRAHLQQPFKEKDGYFYIDTNCLENLESECERIRWTGLIYDPASEYTVAGYLQNGKFSAFPASNEASLYLSPGSFADLRAQVIPHLRWYMAGYFSGSLILLWLGFLGLSRPLLKLIEFLPLVGNAGAGLVRALFLFVALALTALNFLILPHWYVTPVALLALGALLIFKRARKKENVPDL